MPKVHTVASGDLLWKISVKYYGIPGKWTDIVNANPQLKGRKTASDGSPIIRIGDNLIIPDTLEPKENKAPIQAKQTIVLDENITIVLDFFYLRYFVEQIIY